MIPHRLNLLSPEKRQHLKKMVNFQFLKISLELFLVFLCIIGMALLSGRIISQNYLNQLTEHLAAASEHYLTLNLDIKKVNNQIANIEKIQNEYQAYSPLLADIIKSLPDNISLSNLKINQKGTISLSGQAKTREDLLNLKNNLEKSNLVKKVEIPPEQLTAKENVQFSLSLTLVSK